MAQNVRKRPENEFAIKFSATKVVQNTTLKLKSRERGQTLKILNPPRRRSQIRKEVSKRYRNLELQK